MSAKHAKAARRLDLPEHLVVVLERLAWYADCSGQNARPGMERLSLEVNRKERPVRRSLRVLEEMGLIVATAYSKGGKSRATVYDIHIENGKARSGFEMVDGFPVPQSCVSNPVVQTTPFEEGLPMGEDPNPVVQTTPFEEEVDMVPNPNPVVWTTPFELLSGPNPVVQTTPQCLKEELRKEEEISSLELDTSSEKKAEGGEMYYFDEYDDETIGTDENPLVTNHCLLYQYGKLCSHEQEVIDYHAEQTAMPSGIPRVSHENLHSFLHNPERPGTVEEAKLMVDYILESRKNDDDPDHWAQPGVLFSPKICYQTLASAIKWQTKAKKEKGLCPSGGEHIQETWSDGRIACKKCGRIFKKADMASPHDDNLLAEMRAFNARSVLKSQAQDVGR